MGKTFYKVFDYLIRLLNFFGFNFDKNDSRTFFDFVKIKAKKQHILNL